MPRRLTYEEVKNYVESQGETLVSTSYINNRTKLAFKCSKGHIYSMTLSDFKTGYRCRYCLQAHNTYIDRGDYIEVVISNTTNDTSFKISKESLDKVKPYNWRFDGKYVCTTQKIDTCRFTTLQIQRLLVPNKDKQLSVDHINRNTLDNRLENLRLVPLSTQSRNISKSSRNRSGVIGVSLVMKPYPKYIATVNCLDGKHTKTFSINKYGKEKAFELACKQRKDWAKEYNIISS